MTVVGNDVPWVLVVVLFAMNVLLGAAVSWLLGAKSSPAVQGSQTPRGPGMNLARSIGADIALAGGRSSWKTSRCLGVYLNRRRADLHTMISTFTVSLLQREPYTYAVTTDNHRVSLCD